MKLVLIGILVLALFVGCIGPTVNGETDEEEDDEGDPIVEECIALCEAALDEGQDLSAGPCLSEAMEEDSDWVCDVAHDPREDIDNDPANQCPSYGVTADHFVEVDPDCEFITKD